MQRYFPLSRRGFLALSGGTAAALALSPGARSASANDRIDLSNQSANGKPLTDEEVLKSIEQYKKAIWSQRRSDGSFKLNEQYVRVHGSDGVALQGGTILAALSLVTTGESIQNDKLAPTIKLLENYKPGNVYELSLAAHLWSYLPPRFHPLLKKAAERLYYSQANPGAWDVYTPVDKAGDKLISYPGQIGRNCLSLTQYAILGLWQARKRGIRVRHGLWQQAVDLWLKRQRDDGSWHYSDEPGFKCQNSTQKMTCAGATVLYVCQQELFRDSNRAKPQIQQALNKALDWLDSHFSLEVDGWQPQLHGYQYYGYERVALASGRRGFGPNCPDWYQTMGRRLVDQGPTGDMVNNTMDLMFLSRGRVPVWANKIQVSSSPRWNNRPNDLYFANEFLSEARESELAWMLADIDTPAHQWMIAPLAYLSTDGPISLSPEQMNNLRRYIELGGTLVINPEDRQSQKWAAALCSELLPDYPLQPLAADHFLYDGVGQAHIRRGMAKTVSNGARELVVVFDDDYGIKYQADDKPSLDKPEWRLLFNLFLLTTDRGRPHGRLASPFARLKPAKPATTVRVGVARYGKNDRPEPGAYALANHRLAQRHDLGVDSVDVPLDKLDADTDIALLHLSGVGPAELSDEQLSRIERYVRGGGTVLVEMVGGRGAFAQSVGGALEDRLGPSSRVVTGPLVKGPEDKGARIDRFVYRQYTTEQAGGEDTARLRAIELDGRPAVLISYEDLTLGLMHTSYFQTNGYAPDTALDLFANILIQADQKS